MSKFFLSEEIVVDTILETTQTLYKKHECFIQRVHRTYNPREEQDKSDIDPGYPAPNVDLHIVDLYTKWLCLTVSIDERATYNSRLQRQGKLGYVVVSARVRDIPSMLESVYHGGIAMEMDNPFAGYVSNAQIRDHHMKIEREVFESEYSLNVKVNKIKEMIDVDCWDLYKSIMARKDRYIRCTARRNSSLASIEAKSEEIERLKSLKFPQLDGISTTQSGHIELIIRGLTNVQFEEIIDFLDEAKKEASS